MLLPCKLNAGSAGKATLQCCKACVLILICIPFQAGRVLRLEPWWASWLLLTFYWGLWTFGYLGSEWVPWETEMDCFKRAYTLTRCTKERKTRSDRDWTRKGIDITRCALEEYTYIYIYICIYSFTFQFSLSLCMAQYIYIYIYIYVFIFIKNILFVYLFVVFAFL